MGVHREARLAEGIAEHHIGGLAANTGQAHELFQRVRDLPAESVAQGLAEGDQSFRLGAVEPRRLDHLLQFRQVRGSVVGGGAVPSE
jgi:hypothetical protein